jgi:dihydropteroate synthase
MIFCARDITLSFPRPALIMGIVNVTPDSFSDGGKFFDPEAAVQHGLALAAEGADILDVGGESTRPNAEPVPETEEFRRVAPVVEALAARSGKIISIDTCKPNVAREAIKLGAAIVNDIGGNRTDSEMYRVVAETRTGYVLMHMKGTPQTMLAEANYRDVTAEVLDFFDSKRRILSQFGIVPDQIILDPGLGFAKTAEHNLQLLAQLKRFTIQQRPLLIGASRKSFIGKLLGPQDRLPGSLACATWAVLNGAQIIRTHDVTATLQAVRMTEQIQACQS